MFGLKKVMVWGNVPQYHSEHAAGADLCAHIKDSITIASLGRVLVPTNTYVEIPVGYEGQVRARSGLAYKHGITLANAVGTIDSDYRGEIKVLLFNMSDTTYTITNGDRIAQLVICKYIKVSWCVVNHKSLLSKSKRSAGGFGSTGMVTGMANGIFTDMSNGQL